MTAQQPDRIRYKRRVYRLFGEPLEDYFDDQHPKPESLQINLCSACWRGYLARWHVKRDKLYLERLEPFDPSLAIDWDNCVNDENGANVPGHISFLAKIFPDAPAPVFAEWFTGELCLVTGELLHYIHRPYASTYEVMFILQFENGLLTGQKPINHHQTR